MPMVAFAERGVHPPGALVVGILRELPRNKLERELWRSRGEPRRVHRLYRCTLEDMVQRASRLLDELPMADVEWTIELRDGHIILRNTLRENYDWNGGAPVLVRFTVER